MNRPKGQPSAGTRSWAVHGVKVPLIEIGRIVNPDRVIEARSGVFSSVRVRPPRRIEEGAIA